MRRRREELGITVVEAVRQTKVSRSTWRDLEAERRPGISAPVGVKLDEFLGWSMGTTVQAFRKGEHDVPDETGAVADRVDELNDQIVTERTAQLVQSLTGYAPGDGQQSTPGAMSQAAAVWLPVLQRLSPEESRHLMDLALDMLLGHHA